MNFFLIQRLSGGFVLSLVVSVCGLLAFSVQYSPREGGVFMAYLVVLCAYLNIIGQQLFPSLLIPLDSELTEYKRDSSYHAPQTLSIDVWPHGVMENVPIPFYLTGSFNFNSRTRFTDLPDCLVYFPHSSFVSV